MFSSASIVASIAPLLVFDLARNEGAYLYIYFGAVADLAIITAWRASMRHTLHGRKRIILMSILITFSLVSIAQPFQLRSERLTDRANRINDYTALLESYNLEYLLPAGTNQSAFSLNVAEDSYPFLSSHTDEVMDTYFVHLDEAKKAGYDNSSCIIFSSLGNQYPLKPSQRQYPCVDSRIGDLTVWTQAVEYPSTYNIVYGNTLIILEDSGLERDELIEYIKDFRSATSRDVANYIW